ncbi:MAG: 2,3-bisphosphoglycerate-independent phosphoglycerate mutase [Candidatus Eisenbacteria bacterium]|nr:2,3-bisphosphoglycerate-independent phosphoglycerate mutase [Candidatus Eisenbacteria bacterium]
MNVHDLLPSLAQEKGEKIVFVVFDGLGGLPDRVSGKTELEAASKPNLDRLAKKGQLGLIDPVGPGITPGSGPGHLGIFGYDPLEYQVGRGVLESFGIGFELNEIDLAARINFCTLDGEGRITDRRAGRIPTEECERLTALLEGIEIPGVEVFVRPVKEHRAAVIFRGDGLEDGLTDSDPQATGVEPDPVRALKPEAERSAEIANRWIAEARERLRGEERANGLMLRGISRYRPFPSFRERYGLRAVALALYPMYRGLARLVGMDVLDVKGSNASSFEAVTAHYNEYDFFFVHIKDTDKAGEDGDGEAKRKAIEKTDRLFARLDDLPDKVVIVTGDHSTPSQLKSHSWHPVPFLIQGRTVRPDDRARFGESDCSGGSLGRFPAIHILPLALAHAGRLKKFGA